MKKVIVAALAAVVMVTGLSADISASDFECSIYSKDMSSQVGTIIFKLKNDMPITKYEVRTFKNILASVHGHCQGKTKYQKLTIEAAETFMNLVNVTFKK